MADRATVARPYARAAFAYALAAKDFAAWSKLLDAVAEAAADARVARLIGHPQVTDEQMVELFVGVSGKAAGDSGRNFLRTLAENKRLGLLPEIAAPQQKRLMEALKRLFNRAVRMHTRIDDTLIGGAIVRAGDLVIDGSLKGRLARLSSALTN